MLPQAINKIYHRYRKQKRNRSPEAWKSPLGGVSLKLINTGVHQAPVISLYKNDKVTSIAFII